MKRTFFKNMLKYFREYCRCSSVHGIQYFGEKKRTIFERYLTNVNQRKFLIIVKIRIWWFIVCVICLAACITSIYAIYNKWERSPVIVNFANRGTPIYKIPFPAVTICPESKSDRSKFNFTEIMQKKENNVALTSLEEANFEYMSLICNYDSHLDYTNNKTFSEEVYDVMDKVRGKFYVQNCSFISINVSCDDVFVPIFTDEGVCYTFNMLDRSQIFRKNVVHYKEYHHVRESIAESDKWSLQNGYTEDAGLDAYPTRAYLSGANNGFSFNILTSKKDLDYACKNSLQGYRVLLHAPMTIPRPSQKYFRIPLDQNVVAGVQPVMISTSDTIKAYKPQRRKCYFSEERQLQYFKNYTASNCNLECLTNYTLNICGCVNFFMPRENGTEICGTGSISCMKEAEKMMQMIDLSLKIENMPFLDLELNCDCLPICSDLSYDVETSQTDWDWNMLLHARRNLPRVDNAHLSSITIFFKSDNFITSERNELYGPLDFLSNVGGLLGLFTGFSVLSLMEILYFLSVRIICNKYLYGRWSGSES
ncbi:ASC domain containing protein [Asbolus verrucosus]|uniref:ASC domain containing protein n=1 Tax=Asbolus verrucosus TaxID=1661398 RepID=A0A482W908_ASBVE|nr:ASC domain containing protein [Asbolus verrucosus]